MDHQGHEVSRRISLAGNLPVRSTTCLICWNSPC